ncbi:malto-oligosyltrehalose trehalohydrolase [soil metagenome]
MAKVKPSRRLPVGAEVQPGGGVHFRVWAPDHDRVEVVFEESDLEPFSLKSEREGYHSGLVSTAGPGTRYRFGLGDGEAAYPDPASRFQPQGPQGPSEVIDPGAFSWTDGDWQGPDAFRQVLYEMHIGTFTPEGTWESASKELPALADLGITTLEVMPVADFPGRFGWGYDGVNLFSPTRLYGRPEMLKAFIDQAHAVGLAVILDVVYNHFGPDGNYLPKFASAYISGRHQSEWGEAPNFDDEACGPVREFFLANAAYWIEEFHFDGLRVDATQQIFDDSPEHILTALNRRVREVAGGRKTLLIAENELQIAQILDPPERGGYGFDMAWADDFHHSMIVHLTGRNDGYFAEYLGDPQSFVSALKWGFLYQGQPNGRQGRRRGEPTFGRKPSQFVFFLQNHDQLANSMRGERLHSRCGPGRYRAMTALWLLAPQTPMFFQGQEYAASQPFLYFMDHHPELAENVTRGHADSLTQFDDLALPEIQARLPDPADPSTFALCKLDQADRQGNPQAYALHRDLLRLRRDDLALRGPVDGAVVGPEAFVVRYFGPDGDDRLLVVNFGRALHLNPVVEPLLAPPAGKAWGNRWSSEAPEYGGTGAPPVEAVDGWHLPGHAAVLLSPRLQEIQDP